MEAIEFMAKAKEGKTIEIPKEYLSEIWGEFRIILLLQKKTEPKTSSKRKFQALKIKTKGLKFNREDIYDE